MNPLPGLQPGGPLPPHMMMQAGLPPPTFNNSRGGFVRGGYQGSNENFRGGRGGGR